MYICIYVYMYICIYICIYIYIGLGFDHTIVVVSGGDHDCRVLPPARRRLHVVDLIRKTELRDWGLEITGVLCS